MVQTPVKQQAASLRTAKMGIFLLVGLQVLTTWADGCNHNQQTHEQQQCVSGEAR